MCDVLHQLQQIKRTLLYRQYTLYQLLVYIKEASYVSSTVDSVVFTGSTGCLFNKRSLPFGTNTTTTPHKTIQTTTQGTHSSDQVVFINDIQLPEVVNQRYINSALTHVFNTPNCSYNIILGQDFLQVIGIKMDFELDTILWLDT